MGAPTGGVRYVEPSPFCYPQSSLTRAKFTVVDSLAGEGRGVRLSDVAGLKEAKQEVMEFVDYLRRPEYYRSLGARVRAGGYLLGVRGVDRRVPL